MLLLAAIPFNDTTRPPRFYRRSSASSCSSLQEFSLQRDHHWLNWAGIISMVFFFGYSEHFLLVLKCSKIIKTFANLFKILALFLKLKSFSFYRQSSFEAQMITIARKSEFFGIFYLGLTRYRLFFLRVEFKISFDFQNNDVILNQFLLVRNLLKDATLVPYLATFYVSKLAGCLQLIQINNTARDRNSIERILKDTERHVSLRQTVHRWRLRRNATWNLAGRISAAVVRH